MTSIQNGLRSEEFRLIIDEPGPGFRNMATDEALLSALEKQGGPPVFRLYSFDPPTLSVGRFQRTKDVFDFDAVTRDGVELVRRPSAGQAVLHARELTYCVVLGRDHLERFGKREVYKFVVPILLEGLLRLGVVGSKKVESAPGERRNPDCFAVTGEYEIDSHDNRKLVGSAQMVTRFGVLQHGSIPLKSGDTALEAYLNDKPHHELTKTSVSDYTSTDVGFARAVEAFETAVVSMLPAARDRLTDNERRCRTRLENERYTTNAWNRKY